MPDAPDRTPFDAARADRSAPPLARGEWGALAAASLAAFAVSLGFVVAIALRRRLIGGAALGWVVAASLFLNLFRDAGLTSNPSGGWAGLTVLAVAGLVAVTLTRPRHGD